MNTDYLKYPNQQPPQNNDPRFDALRVSDKAPPYPLSPLHLLDQAQDEQRKLESRVAELEEMLALAANNTAAADLAQEMEFLLANLESIVSVDAVESFLKSLEFSDKCDDDAITLVHGNIRNFAWIIRNEVARLTAARDGDKEAGR